MPEPQDLRRSARECRYFLLPGVTTFRNFFQTDGVAEAVDDIVRREMRTCACAFQNDASRRQREWIDR